MSSELNKEFSTEEYQMVEKHLKKCSTSLIIREIQIKTTLRFHLTPSSMAKIKNSGDSRCWRRCGERGTLLHCWWDCKLVQPLWKSVWRLLRKLDISFLRNIACMLHGGMWKVQDYIILFKLYLHWKEHKIVYVLGYSEEWNT